MLKAPVIQLAGAFFVGKWGLLFSWEEDSGMKEFWNFIQMVFMAVGG